MDDRFGEPINYQFAERNKTLAWFYTDDESLSAETGDPRKVEYRFNDWGFRMDCNMGEIEPGCPIYLGDSGTLGLGVNIEDTWSWKLHHNYTKSDKQYVNLSSTGGNGETWYRLLRYWIPKLKPCAVFLLEGFMNRMELITHASGIRVIGSWDNATFRNGKKIEAPDSMEKEFYRTYLASPQNNWIQQERNHAALKYLMQEHDIPLHYAPAKNIVTLESRGIDTRFHGGSREGLHPGPEQHDNFMQYIIETAGL